ncbi:MAG TPA: response regulator [Myxococcota bacterium]|nr:response regulator [Myxococcota bacterium]HRY95641.1 response regulator [Myxococcota bacterium]
MKRILVVDDDPDILNLERRVLEREGYEVVTAAEGLAAKQLLQTEAFDLVLLDIMMPGADGFEVSRALPRAKGQRHTPVVFVTARDDPQALREGFRSGGTVFLTKPFTAGQLTRIVHSMLG